MQLLFLAIRLAILVFAGFLIRRLKVVDGNFERQLSKFTTTLALPCLIIDSLNVEFSAQELKNGAVILLVSLCTLIFLYLLGWVLFRLRGRDAIGRMIHFGTVFPNFTFVGMPVQLLALLRACGRGSLRRALVSGDACPESVMRGCEEILGTKLFPHYGSREMGMAGAITCPAHEGMHLRENQVIAEIVDRNGRVLSPGEWGELVITTVGMEALPLIRYRTGDCTRILPDPCPCGSEAIRLDRVRRMGEAEIAELDDALFTLPGLIDYSVHGKTGILTIRAITAGALSEEDILMKAKNVFPKEEIQVYASPLNECDRTLYPGKRTILRQAEK